MSKEIGITDPEPILFLVCPEAMTAWDYNRNTIKPEDVDPQKYTKAYWKCEKGHSFQRPVATYIYKTKSCPECRKLDASIAGKPWMVDYWDYSKNTSDPADISAKSEDIFWWICKRCGYSWQAQARSRADKKKGSKCPCCDSNTVIKQGINDFRTVYPELALDTSDDMNPGIDLGSEGTGSHKTINWQCHVCGYKWSAPIYGRIRREKTGYRIAKCPVCGGNRKVITFDVQYPDLLKYYSKDNPRKLSEIGGTEYQERFIWECEKHGQFEAVLASMIRSVKTGNNGCPYCHGNKIKPEDSFAEKYPDLMKEWSDNNVIDPYTLAPYSKYDAEWVCEKGHKWHAIVQRRTYGYDRCPVCYPFGRKYDVLFADVFPQFKKNYSPKNEFPYEFFPVSSNKEAIWVCDQGHEFTRTFNAIFKSIPHDAEATLRCPVCDGRTIISGYNDFATLYPQYANDWDEERNGVPANEISPSESDMSRYWTCKNGHTFNRSVRAHISWNGICPVCSKHVLQPGVNDLLSYCPEIKNYWDYEQNDKRPEECLVNLGKVYYFVCENNHHFRSAVSTMLENDFACPICGNNRVGTGHNDLATVNPDLAKEWSPRNKKSASEMMATSGKQALWICPDCGGEYSCIIKERYVGDQSCPFCNNHKVLPGYNDLATIKPELVSEWSEKNTKSPDEVMVTAQEVVLWKCPICNGEYNYSIREREAGDDSCPYCNQRKALPGYNDLSTLYPELAKEWSPNNGRPASQVLPTFKVSALWICPDCGAEYAYTISERKQGVNACPYCRNWMVMPGNNDLATLNPALAAEWSPKNDRSPSEVLPTFAYDAVWVCPKCGGEYRYPVKDRHVGDDKCPYCRHIRVLAGFNDLQTTDADLAKEWSPNNELRPSDVFKSSNLYVNWICPKCGGEYSSKIKDRFIGDDSCPYCRQVRVLPGFNDLATTDPDLALEWSPNNDRTPSEVRKTLFLDVLWICPDCGGEYRYPIRDRNVGDDSCPYCRNKKVLSGYNDLSSTKPHIAAEWCEIENGLLGIDVKSILPGSTQTVWWKCNSCGRKYTMSIKQRVLFDRRNMIACPYCRGRRQLRVHFF